MAFLSPQTQQHSIQSSSFKLPSVHPECAPFKNCVPATLKKITSVPYRKLKSSSPKKTVVRSQKQDNNFSPSDSSSLPSFAKDKLSIFKDSTRSRIFYGKNKGYNALSRNQMQILQENIRRDCHDTKSFLILARSLPVPDQQKNLLLEGINANIHSQHLWHALAMYYLNMTNDIDKAHQTLRYALNHCKQGTRGALFQSLALIHIRLRSPDHEIISIFNEGFHDQPSHGSLYVALADFHRSLGDLDKFEQTVELGIKNAKHYAPLWRLLASYRERQQRFSDAIECWKKSIKLEPKSHSAYIKISKLYQMQNQHQLASEVLDSARSVIGDQDATLLRTIALQKASMQRSSADPSEFFEKAAEIELQKNKTPKSFHSWGLFELRQGNFDAARNILTQALSYSPDDTSILRALGELEVRLNNFESARTNFRRAVALKPKDVRLWYSWAKCESVAGDDLRAEQLYKYGKSISHRDADIISTTQDNDIENARAKIVLDWSSKLERDGDFEKAKTLLENSILENQSQPRIFRQLANLYLRENNENKARKLYASACTIVPHHLSYLIYHWWGMMEQKLGNAEHARKHFEKSISVNPEYVAVRVSYALLEKSQGDLKHTCDILQEAAQKAEKCKIPFQDLYLLWSQSEKQYSGDIGKARKILEQGLELMPLNGTLYQGYGLLEEGQANFDKARELYKKGIKAAPRYSGNYHCFGILEMKLGNLDLAEKIFEAGYNRNSEATEILASWGLLEGRRRGNVSRGRELFEEAIRIDPYNWKIWHTYGTLELSAGNPDRAKELYLEALRNDRTNPTILHALGMLEKGRQSYDLARDYFERAIKVAPKHALSYQSLALLEADAGSSDAVVGAIYRNALAICTHSTLLYQSWAIYEARRGDVEAARRIFQAGLDLQDPVGTVSLYHAYGVFERNLGNRSHARDLFQSGSERYPREAAPIYASWGLMEAMEGHEENARELFERGMKIDPYHRPLRRAYATFEKSVGNIQKAESLLRDRILNR